MFQQIIDMQREIYLTFASHIKDFAAGGGWGAFLAFLPMGIVFGAVHAMTPGHSKSVLATYLAGSSTKAHRALVVSLALSFTHVTMAVLIALLALPLVSHSFVNAGSLPALEVVSRGLLGVIGLWMVLTALLRHSHSHAEGEGLLMGFAAGLVPCPLTLFVMTFAMIHQVVVTGLLFAATMMMGVALTLSAVALLAVVFRDRISYLMRRHPQLLASVSRAMAGLAGLVLVAIAAIEIANWLNAR
ncbi:MULTISPECIES: HoxN/HupN/NixA family nickel/cobalt transporter [unclassified Rhizobium]|uniref:HoxN/HupN/NixA family nickel/cobalt transporter n=1 Tax=unclassified Rhizobium TaxID=2613769 RepID=UPI0007F114CC|nr:MULTISPECIES: ABC transporter permease [unclassified Rhizobium]ANK89281.1 high-affinity nickel/cobalt transporter protein [Rhizobium sp. N731]ANL19533.1 high-affinity nickel/cobalt transporter protein [Rhizobium sp. N1314]